MILLMILIYLWCIKPNKLTKERRKKMQTYISHYIAHRGLFDSNLSIPENSIPAFKRAVEHGFGIELDVRLTKDRQLVVFHDATLLRMCGVNKKVADLTYEELKQYRLEHTNHGIPALKEVLNVIEQKVPVVIEIKAEKNSALTAKILDQQLKARHYNSNFCIESFKPFALKWYRDHRPEIIRGQLVSDYIKNRKNRSLFVSLILNGLLLNVFSRPDFIAYNYKCANKEKYRIMRKLFQFISAGWTFKSEEELKRVRNIFEIIIFDGFIPSNQKAKGKMELINKH